MRYYMELFKRRLQQSLAYRFNWAFGFASGFLMIFIKVSIWRALYAGKTQVAGADLSDMITYVLLADIVGTVTSAYFIGSVSGGIRSGGIGMQLIRPVRFEVAEVAENIAGTLSSLIFRLIPVITISALVFGMQALASPQHVLAFVGLLFGSVVMNYYLQFILGATCFWFTSPAYGITIDNLFSVIFAGTFIPLWFFPRFIQTVATYLPYHYLTYIPNAVYLGKVPITDIPRLFLVQWGWIAGVVVLKRIIWAQGMKKIVIQGG